MLTLSAAIEIAAARFAASIRLLVVVDDPYDRRPQSMREWLVQARDVVRHEFWMAADEPARSPGARLIWQ